jgi:beta-glucosidase
MMSADTSIGSASETDSERRFPPGFVWGVATASYQIEGAVDTDSRGESIWDRFCTEPGRILDGSSGADACEHYARWPEDIALMRGLGLGGYRFSIAWPRVVPEGVGAVNPAGLDFYDRLVDGLLAAGIEPYPTLYHWDLPQALEDAGGWPNRDTAAAFADYAAAVVERLGDRIRCWMTLNEPFVSAHHGYISGEHAPGRTSLRDGMAAAHHLLLAHGLGLERIRALAPQAEAGIVLNFTPVLPGSGEPADVEHAEITDDFENRWYVEPLTGHGYPPRTAARLGWDQSEVLPGDLERIAQPIDVLGVNYYTRQLVLADEDVKIEPPGPTTARGWEIHPESLGLLLRGLHARYGFRRYMITENGAAMPDADRLGGHIHDPDRIDYLAGHLAEVHGAIADGVPVDGYFAWSLLDNFEWAFGYGSRFGLVEVDFVTQERIPKSSGRWYGELATSGILRRPDA